MRVVRTCGRIGRSKGDHYVSDTGRNAVNGEIWEGVMGWSAGWWGRARQLLLCARIWDFTVWGRGTGIEIMGINFQRIGLHVLHNVILQHSALIESLSDNTRRRDQP